LWGAACLAPTPVGTLFSGRDQRASRVFSGDFHMHPRKSAFFQPFLRFFLAFSIFLGYSRWRPEFFTEKQGVASSAPASIASEWKDKSGG
jgi:hypothetical protein